jgi:hypothetical protein
MATSPLTDQTTRDDYVSTAGQTTFPYTFWIRDEDHLDVFVNGVLQTIGGGNDYTVSAVQSVTGANVVFNSGLTLNDAVAIVYNPDVERATDFSTGGSLRASALNLELTYGLSLIQFLKTQLSRTITFNPSDPVSASLVLPAATASNVIGWNAAGDGLTNYSFASLSSAVDTNLTGLSDGDVLAYNLSTELFEPTALVNLTDNNNTFTGTNVFQGVVDVTNVNAEGSGGGNLRTNGGTNCLSWGGGGSANLTAGGNLSMGTTHKIVNMADPSADQDAATKKYVDDEIAANPSAVLQAQSIFSTTGLTASGSIPNDDTIPQITEGDLALTLAFTPVSATSKLYIRYGGSIDLTGSNNGGFVLFKDSGVDAISSCPKYGPASNFPEPCEALFIESSGSTTARTYTMRFGGDTVGADIGANTAKWGNTNGYYIQILEVAE